MSRSLNIGCFLSDVSTGGGYYLTKDFAKNILKLNSNDYKITLVTTTNIYNEECDDKLFLLRYNQILNQFKSKKHTF